MSHSFVNFIIKRSLSTTTVRHGKRNFRKFPIYNKRGSRNFKLQQSENPDPDVPVHKRGVRDVAYKDGDKLILIPEKIPELVVPDLTDFKLKPYVSYRAPDVVQSQFTAEDLFNVVYAPKILKDFENGKLDDNGQPLEPSADEKMTAEEAKLKARQTGSDIF
ncbi:39S ribosomal protein L41, mitochondrial [Anoplophora glabripennis]|uniref:39S ribosomal protein L41, mitochondrial n=1 Tax=Anoplophora glabripennis TaxID=217634 RepID=UPI0008744DBB|nr:39S ribosomal protein L41, mitochondrial [Anoplophora glabripennis]